MNKFEQGVMAIVIYPCLVMSPRLLSNAVPQKPTTTPTQGKPVIIEEQVGNFGNALIAPALALACLI